MLSCAVLSCAVDNYIYMLFEGHDLPQRFSLLHVAVSSTSFTFTFSNTSTYTYTYTYTCTYTCACVCACACALVCLCVWCAFHCVDVCVCVCDRVGVLCVWEGEEGGSGGKAVRGQKVEAVQEGAAVVKVIEVPH